MHVAGLSLPLVFAAGLVSFISPCVLPLLPGYLSTVSGVSFEQMATRERGIGRAVGSASALFFLGFLAVFVALGASASVIGELLTQHRLWLNRISGGPIALGVAFAFCWTPCVGPILATILTVAGASASLQSGVLLLAVYGLGLAVPFIAVGFGFTRALGAFKRLQRHYRTVERFGGLLLISMGVLLLSGYLFVLNIYAQHALARAHLDWWKNL